MRRHLFSVYDRTAQVYNAPFVATNAAVAQRMVDQGKTDPGSLFATHPDDFTVMELGEFDDELGLLIPHPTPRAALWSPAKD